MVLICFRIYLAINGIIEVKDTLLRLNFFKKGKTVVVVQCKQKYMAMYM